MLYFNLDKMKKYYFIFFLCALMIFGGCSISGKTTSVIDLLSLDEALVEVTGSLEQYVQEKTEIVIAEIRAPLDDISNFLSAELTTHLVDGGTFIVLERGPGLEYVDKEHQFQLSGFVSDESIVGIGHYLEAKVVITGSFSRYANFNQLRLRVLDVQSSQIIISYTSKIRPDDAVLKSVLFPLKNDKLSIITEDVLAHLNQGEDFLREGKYEDAIHELNVVLTKDRNLAEGYFFRGLTYYEKGDLELAIIDYSSALKLNPVYCDALNNRGIAYRSIGDIEKAIEDYNTALNIKPDFYEVLNSRGVAYSFKNDFNQAIADYTALLIIKPNHYLALYNRGITYKAIGNHRQAIADYTTALEIKPDFYEALNNRGNIHRDAGNSLQAIKDFNSALEIKPDFWEGYFNRGLTYSNMRDYNRAISDFTSTLTIKPDLIEALNNRGVAYANKFDYDRAIADWETVLRISPNDPTASNNIEVIKKVKETYGI